MRVLSVFALVAVSSASLAAASVHSTRSFEPSPLHHLERRSKTGECTQAYIDNKNSGYCKHTCPLNQWPLFEGGCVCRAPYKLQGSNCVPDCVNGFSINTAKTGCICREGKVTNVDKSKCLAACTSGSYPVGDGTCASCPSAFAKCSSATVATACADGFFLSSGQCVTKENCPTNTFANAANNRCTACADKDALSCSDAGTTSALACTTKFLYGGQCLAASDVPDGYYPNTATLTASPCDTGVKACSGTGAGHALSCGKNSQGDQLLLTPKGTCALHCQSGYYGNKAFGVCIACDSTEKTCDADGAKTCNKDSAGRQLFLTPNRKCVLPTQIPPSYYPDAASSTFKPCRDGVTSCTGPKEGDDLTCGTTSKKVTLYLDSSRNTCVEQAGCPVSTWANAFDNTCTACDEDEVRCSANGAGSALECKPNFFLAVTNDCLTAAQCALSGAFWADAVNKVCSRCDAGEAACTGNGAGLATACAKNDAGAQLYLNEGDCVVAALCPSTHFADDESKSDAYTCGADESDNRLYLNIAGADKGLCVLPADCDKSTYSNPTTNHCEPCTDLDKDATSCTNQIALSCGSLFLQGGKCVAAPKCLPHTFADTSVHECTHCADPDALQCDASKALKCENKFLYDGSCLASEKCPPSTFANIDTHECTPCTNKFDNAGTCDAESAKSCFANYLLDGACVEASKCPVGSYASTKYNACLACSALDPFATTCTEAAGATSCSNSLSVYKGSCGTCPDWTYPDGDPSFCVDCSNKWEGATKCTKDTLLACDAATDWKLATSYGRQCTKTCPFVGYNVNTQSYQGFATYYDPSKNECIACEDPLALQCSNEKRGATQCKNSWWVLDNVCVQSCPTTGYYKSNGVCLRCVDTYPGSLTCSDARALTCDNANGWYMWERKGQCSKGCRTGQTWADNINNGVFNTYLSGNVCKDCKTADYAVFTCDAQGTPTSCDRWYYYQGECRIANFCRGLGNQWIPTEDSNGLGICYQCPGGSSPSQKGSLWSC
ncbi:hypothetical protein JCM10450v2_003196 [Rhodotorula kratochvilovae]